MYCSVRSQWTVVHIQKVFPWHSPYKFWLFHQIQAWYQKLFANVIIDSSYYEFVYYYYIRLWPAANVYIQFRRRSWECFVKTGFWLFLESEYWALPSSWHIIYRGGVEWLICYRSLATEKPRSTNVTFSEGNLTLNANVKEMENILNALSRYGIHVIS